MKTGKRIPRYVRRIAVLFCGLALCSAVSAAEPKDATPGGGVQKPSGEAKDEGAAQFRPAPLAADMVEVALPAPAGEVCVGGGGRFIIMHLPTQKQLAIFDVLKAKIVKYLPAAEEDIRFAAGAEKLFVANPTAGALQRYSLTTFEREVTAKLPVAGHVHCLLLGSAAAGPLFIGGTGGLLALDPITLKTQKFTWTDANGRAEEVAPFDFKSHAPSLRINASGRVITAWHPDLSPGGLAAYRMTDAKTFKGVYEHETVVYNLPSPDGQVLYTVGRIYTVNVKPLGKPAGGYGQMVWYLPAVRGAYYLAVLQVAGSGNNKSSLAVEIHMQGQDQSVLSLHDLAGLDGLVDWNSGHFAQFDQHIFYVPDANLLAILPAARDKLILHRVDVEKKLEESGIDYLLVTSQPPTEFKLGATLTYQIEAKAKKGGLKFKLESGPDGMTLSPKGLLKWPVPPSLKEQEVNVIITVSDATGQEIFHNLKMSNAGAAARK